LFGIQRNVIIERSKARERIALNYQKDFVPFVPLWFKHIPKKEQRPK
jgi:hypothetical protein